MARTIRRIISHGYGSFWDNKTLRTPSYTPTRRQAVAAIEEAADYGIRLSGANRILRSIDIDPEWEDIYISAVAETYKP